MAIELERKRRLGFAFSLKSNNTDTTKKIQNLLPSSSRTREQEKSIFSDEKHHAFLDQRAASGVIQNCHLRHWLTQKLARNCKKIPVHRLLLVCSKHRIKNPKSPLRKSSYKLSSKVKKKGLNRFGTSDHWSQSCAKTSPQKPVLSLQWRGRRRRKHPASLQLRPSCRRWSCMNAFG